MKNVKFRGEKRRIPRSNSAVKNPRKPKFRGKFRGPR